MELDELCINLKKILGGKVLSPGSISNLAYNPIVYKVHCRKLTTSRKRKLNLKFCRGAQQKFPGDCVQSQLKSALVCCSCVGFDQSLKENRPDRAASLPLYTEIPVMNLNSHYHGLSQYLDKSVPLRSKSPANDTPSLAFF